jgi:hypothetical protein
LQWEVLEMSGFMSFIFSVDAMPQKLAINHSSGCLSHWATAITRMFWARMADTLQPHSRKKV